MTINIYNFESILLHGFVEYILKKYIVTLFFLVRKVKNSTYM